MSNFADLSACAAQHLQHYLDPRSGTAFSAYDVRGDPRLLLPVDVLAPALLKAPLRASDVIAMRRDSGPSRTLWDALQAVLTLTDPEHDLFQEQDLSATTGSWALVRAALAASDHVKGLKASKVTKILHRKRPVLVPIFDSRVAGFYGVPVSTPWDLWPRLKSDVLDHHGWLVDLAGDVVTPDGRPLSVLRVLDMIVWEHSAACPSM